MRIKMLRIGLILFSAAVWANEKPNNLGQNVYQAACINCHAPDKAKDIGAPAAFNKQAWNKTFAKERKIAKQERKPFPSYLINRVRLGKGLMYHSGLCLESQSAKVKCSDTSLKAAIEYMSKQPLK